MGSACPRPERWDAVLAHRERLLRIARARTPSAEDAEDVVQEALLRCAQFENLDEERMGRFLTTVTLRLCVDEHRRRTQSAKLGRRLESEPVEVPGSDEAVCDRAEATWVAGLVANLPPRQREVLAAKADGMSCREIGSRYRMSYKAVESALTHARSALRAALAVTSCLLGAAVARLGWRTRAATLAAMPVAAVSFVAAVNSVTAPDDRPRPAAEAPQGRPPGLPSVTNASAETSIERPGPVRRGGGATPAAPRPGAAAPAGTKAEREYARVEAGGHGARVYDPEGAYDGPDVLEDPAGWAAAYPRYCADNGVTVWVHVEPTVADPFPGVHQSCGGR